MTDPDVPDDVLRALRRVCASLPEAYEEDAWVGVRWRVRSRTFAHVLVVASGWPPAYARVIGEDGPTVLLMFRSSGEELDVLRAAGPPFYAPPWRQDEVVMVLGPTIDRTELAELVTESYRCQAPRALVAQLDGSAP